MDNMGEMKERLRKFFESKGFTVKERRGVRPPSFYVEKTDFIDSEFSGLIKEAQAQGIELRESFAPQIRPGQFCIWL